MSIAKRAGVIQMTIKAFEAGCMIPSSHPHNKPDSIIVTVIDKNKKEDPA